MTDLILSASSWVLLLTGSLVCVFGAVGVLRFPDFFTRIHAAGVTDTLGAGLILVGLALQATDLIVVAKLLLLLVFAMLTGPTATHALAKSALHGKLRPVLAGQAATRDGGESSSTS